MKRHRHLLIRLQNMSTPTTTIRVPIETRDRLAAQARTRGVSIAALLTELAGRTEREALLKAEREATRADATKQAVRDEAAEWDDTVNDGLEIE
jgi:hypothetical protein